MKQDNELKITLEQKFNVPVERVYEAWTNPDQLKQWWKPMNNTIKEIINDLKEGGHVSYIFEGNKLRISGEYVRVKENELLEYTWNWELPDDPVKNSSYKLTIQFVGEGNGSSIHVMQDAFVNDEGMLPHYEGWKKGLIDLSNYLNGSSN